MINKYTIKKIINVLKPTKYLKAQISYLSPHQRLVGKRILITGGGRGLGFFMAKKFVSEGAEVVITGRDENCLKRASEIIGCGYEVLDITSFINLEEKLRIIDNKIGGINVLVNNAGISLHEGNIFNVGEDQFDKQFNTNLKGPYFLTQKFLEIYLSDNRKNGSVLFVSSERGTYVDDLPYGLTKASINSLTQGLAKLMIHNDIRINAIAPGVTASDMTGREVGGNMYAPNYSTGRTYQPEEIAEIACFLISDAALCLSGQILNCNNGDSANSYMK